MNYQNNNLHWSRQVLSQARRFAFLLIPDFSMIAFSSAVEVLRLANRELKQTSYVWKTLAFTGNTITSSNGINIQCDASLDKASNYDVLLICGGIEIEKHYNRQLDSALRRLGSRKLILGSLCTGSYLLARAELLEGYRSTIHWENLASFREQFPSIIISQELFEIDRDRITCAGGTASIDLMLNVIRAQQGNDIASAVAEELICERIRGQHDRQRIPLRQKLGTGQPKLIEAVSLMEANVEEPMTLDEVAKAVGLSRRQLERLFQKHLNRVPTRYYLELRLDRARLLLLQTSMSIVDVAFASGFVSAPHFSKCFRDHFGIAPSEARKTDPGNRPN